MAWELVQQWIRCHSAKKWLKCIIAIHNALLIMLGINDLLNGATAEVTASRMALFLEHIDIHTAAKTATLLAPPSMRRGEWVPEDQLVGASRELDKI